MYPIQQITSIASQQQNLVLADGSTISFTIQFVPMQYGWFITQLIYGSFQINGLRITNSPNMLYQFKNQIPFGIACISKSDREPSQQQDFSSGASQLFILTAAEVQTYAEFLADG